MIKAKFLEFSEKWICEYIDGLVSGQLDLFQVLALDRDQVPAVFGEAFRVGYVLFFRFAEDQRVLWYVIVEKMNSEISEMSERSEDSKKSLARGWSSLIFRPIHSR
jgi:hypothetical protein